MKIELDCEIENKYVELEGMLNRRRINTIDRLAQFQHGTLHQYQVEHAERIDSAQEKLRELEQEAAKYYNCEANVAKHMISFLKNEEINRLRIQLAVNFQNLQRQSILLRINLMQEGLTPERIQQFDHFQADETQVDGQCSICIEDFEVGRRLMRLDCDGHHVFCQVCIEGWFADHKTCPICRHIF